MLHHAHPIRRFLMFCVLLLSLASLTSSVGASDTVTIRPTPIPFEATELVNPMRGYYRWYGNEGIPQPQPARDHYARFSWRQLEPTRGIYKFDELEQHIEQARQQGAKFAFRVMAVNEFSEMVEVPAYLVEEAGGAYCMYDGKRVWVPDWNSQAFLERAQALINALGKRYDGDPRLSYYDMGVYGHWGEWHTDGLCTPAGTLETQRAIVDMQIAAFPQTRLVMNAGGNTVDSVVYALKQSPRIGVRVDNLCDKWFEYQFLKFPEKAAIVRERWKTAPIIAEFLRSDPPDLSLCEQQMRKWHITAIASGQIYNWGNYTPMQQAQLLALGKTSGYRFAMHELQYPTRLSTNRIFSIESQWSNQGIAPAYERYAVTFELRLRDSGDVVWSTASQLNLEQLVPSTTNMVCDSFYLPRRVPAGVYTLNMVVQEPFSHRAPLALAIAGADEQGRYQLGTVTVEAGPPGEELFVPMIVR